MEKKEKGPWFDAQLLPASARHLADEADDLAPEPGGVESAQVVPIQCHHASRGVIEALQQGSHCGLSWKKGKLEVWEERVLETLPAKRDPCGMEDTHPR